MGIIDSLLGKKKKILSAADFIQAALEKIHRSFPEDQAEIVSDEEIKVILNPNTPNEVNCVFNTANAYSAYVRQPEELTKILERYVLSLDELREQENDCSLDIVIKTLVSAEWYEYVAEQQKDAPKENQIYFQPITGDIGFSYIFDRENSSKYLSNEEVAAFQAQESAFESVTAQNFDNYWLQRGLNIDRVVIGHTESVIGISLDETFEKNLVLSELFWKQLEELEVDASWEDQNEAQAIQNIVQTQGDWLFIVPARSHLLLAKSSDPDAMTLLQGLVKNYFEQTEYPLSQCIFRRTKQGVLEVVATVQPKTLH